MMGRFLHSFARRSEVYGVLTRVALPVVPNNAMSADPTSHGWATLRPVLLDPVRDNIVRDLNGGADIRDLVACRDDGALYLRLDCRSAITGRITYRFSIRSFGAHEETSTRAQVFEMHPFAQ